MSTIFCGSSNSGRLPRESNYEINVSHTGERSVGSRIRLGVLGNGYRHQRVAGLGERTYTRLFNARTGRLLYTSTLAGALSYCAVNQMTGETPVFKATFQALREHLASHADAQTEMGETARAVR